MKRSPAIDVPIKINHMMNPATAHELLARRAFLGRASLGLGSVALAGLLQPKLWGADTSIDAALDLRLLATHGCVRPLHFMPKAKRIIFLCMAGGPSQFETFDEKP